MKTNIGYFRICRPSAIGALAFSFLTAAASAASPAAAPAAIDAIRGTVSVDPHLSNKTGVSAGDASGPLEGALFVIARKPGAKGGGPPIAVKRILRPSFPQAFELGKADAMMSSADFAGPLAISAKYTARGDAMTHAGDWLGEAKASVPPGTVGVAITLGRVAP